ncbi:MAG: hypothetical protein ABUT39_17270 [Acidobacteriota bacterium]
MGFSWDIDDIFHRRSAYFVITDGSGHLVMMGRGTHRRPGEKLPFEMALREDGSSYVLDPEHPVMDFNTYTYQPGTYEMTTSSLIKQKQPRLEALFGTISQAERDEMLQAFRGVDEQILAWGRHAGYSAPGWEERAGLTLTLFMNGTALISGDVWASPVCLSFSLSRTRDEEGVATGASWTIETVIGVDCDHAEWHGEHVVHEVTVEASTPVEAAIALRDGVQELFRLGMTMPSEAWIQMAADQEPDDEQP